MKAEEKADIKRGTPGVWITNPRLALHGKGGNQVPGTEAKPLYIPGWMIAAEHFVQNYTGDALILQVGPFWDKGE